MKLKEVCESTGLSRKTIRLYEEKGLLVPKKEWRNGREYREYTEADLKNLRIIALLRRAWFTMEEIRQMQEDPEAIQEIFPQYCRWLQQQKRELDELIAVAQSIQIGRIADIAQLTEEMSSAAEKLPLPTWDASPRFKYLDEIEEEVRNMNQNDEQKMQEARKKTYRQSLLLLDQDKGNNHAITFGQIKEVEEANWYEEQVIKGDEHLPKILQILSRISFIVMLIGIIIFCCVYGARVFLAYGSSLGLPPVSYISLGMALAGLAVYGMIRGYAAWKERQAWIARMRQQDLEKAKKQQD